MKERCVVCNILQDKLQMKEVLLIGDGIFEGDILAFVCKTHPTVRKKYHSKIFNFLKR